MILFWWRVLKQELNWVIVWFLWAIMWEGWKGFYFTSLSGILKRVSPSFQLPFLFCLVHKNKTRGQLEQFKKYSRKLLSFCCFSPPAALFFIIFFGNLRSHQKKRMKLTNKKGLWDFTMSKKYKKHGIMLSIKAIFSLMPVKSFFPLYFSSSFCSQPLNFVLPKKLIEYEIKLFL